MKKPSILCVDDEINILEGLQDNLRKQFKVYTATSGTEALALIESAGPFPVVISDMRMPQMNGAEFLKTVCARSPDTMRILLTGQSDMDSAISAVNEGQIFRFLTKPCPTEHLSSVIQTALDHHRLASLEKDLLENTLQGCVEALVEVLQLTNPVAFSRTNRLKQYVGYIATELNLPDSWQFEVAALLSQVGFVTLPAETVNKLFAGQALDQDEQLLLKEHTAVAHRLINKIPRLEHIACMILKQHDYYAKATESLEATKERTSKESISTSSARDTTVAAANDSERDQTITIGAQMLHIASEYDATRALGATHEQAILEIRKTLDTSLAPLIDALTTLTPAQDNDTTVFMMANVDDLKLGMIFDQEVTATNGLLLMPSGQIVTHDVIKRLDTFAKRDILKQPFRVQIAS